MRLYVLGTSVICLSAFLSACGHSGSPAPEAANQENSSSGTRGDTLSDAVLQGFLYTRPADEPDYLGTPENTEVVDVATGRSYTVQTGRQQLTVGKIAAGHVTWPDGRTARVPVEAASLSSHSLQPQNIYTAFRRVVSSSGYRKINAQITLPASVSGLSDSTGEAAYNYLGFSNSSNLDSGPSLNAEFGLYTDCTTAQNCGKWLIYRRFGGAQIGQQPSGTPAIFNPSTQLTIRLFVSSEVNPQTGATEPSAVFQYNVTGGAVQTIKYFNVPNLTTNASNLYLRRVSSLLLNKVGSTKAFWRTVSISTATTTSPFTASLAAGVTTTSNVTVTNSAPYTDEDLLLKNP